MLMSLTDTFNFAEEILLSCPNDNNSDNLTTEKALSSPRNKPCWINNVDLFHLSLTQEANAENREAGGGGGGVPRRKLIKNRLHT